MRDRMQYRTQRLDDELKETGQYFLGEDGRGHNREDQEEEDEDLFDKLLAKEESLD